MSEKPILLAKIKETASGRISLIAGEGELRAVRGQDRKILEQMNGFQTISDIANILHIPIQAVEDVFNNYKGDRYLTTFDCWNKLCTYR